VSTIRSLPADHPARAAATLPRTVVDTTSSTAARTATAPAPSRGEADVDQMLCPALLAAMALLGKRWNGLVIQALGTGPQRFVDIRRGIPGISDAVLARRLGELQHCELIERVDGATRAPYRLTAKGRDLLPVLDALTAWAERWSVAEHLAAACVKDIAGDPVLQGARR
jgi:DNA-binding HxlR family transcriptional regulator